MYYSHSFIKIGTAKFCLVPEHRASVKMVVSAHYHSCNLCKQAERPFLLVAAQWRLLCTATFFGPEGGCIRQVPLWQQMCLRGSLCDVFDLSVF